MSDLASAQRFMTLNVDAEDLLKPGEKLLVEQAVSQEPVVKMLLLRDSHNLPYCLLKCAAM